MNRSIFFTVLVLNAIVICTSCNNEDPPSSKIEEFTLENFPLLDGSTSTEPLVKLIACKLLGYDYRWGLMPIQHESWLLWTNLPDEFVEKHLKSSQTHNAFINLIDKKADLIFSARKMSADEKAYAAKANVSLIETPIALDALTFFVNSENQITSLTHEQLQDIYKGTIQNWKDIGGNDAPIIPYVRNRNSGSQELMESLVLSHEQISNHVLEDNTIYSMRPILTMVQDGVNGLGYTVFYYKENIIRDLINVKTLAVNGVYPDEKTIENETYPYVAEVFVIIRSDLVKSSMAYKIYELLQTDEGKRIITESGYVPN